MHLSICYFITTYFIFICTIYVYIFFLSFNSCGRGHLNSICSYMYGHYALFHFFTVMYNYSLFPSFCNCYVHYVFFWTSWENVGARALYIQDMLVLWNLIYCRISDLIDIATKEKMQARKACKSFFFWLTPWLPLGHNYLVRHEWLCSLYHLWRHQFKCHQIFLISR